MKNIVFIARNFPPAVGGAQRLNASLYAEFKHHCSVCLIANTTNQRSLRFYIEAPLILTSHAMSTAIEGLLLSDAALLPLVPVTKRVSKRVVLQCYGLDLTYPNPLYLLMVSKLIPSVDAVICISDFVRAKCLSLGVNPNDCFVIHPGLDDPLAGRNISEEDVQRAKAFLARHTSVDPRKDVTLLSVGRLVPRKGFVWFVSEVFPRLRDCFPNLKYIIVGGGPNRAVIAHAAKKAGVTEAVTLVGRVSTTELAQYYMGSDIFVMPNIPHPTDVEGFGLVIPEAGCYGLPVVAAAVHGIPEAMKGEGIRGVLVPPADVQAFEAALGRLATIAPLPTSSRNHIRKSTLKAHKSWRDVATDYLRVVLDWGF